MDADNCSPGESIDSVGVRRSGQASSLQSDNEDGNDMAVAIYRATNADGPVQDKELMDARQPDPSSRIGLLEMLLGDTNQANVEFEEHRIDVDKLGSMVLAGNSTAGSVARAPSEFVESALRTCRLILENKQPDEQIDGYVQLVTPVLHNEVKTTAVSRDVYAIVYHHACYHPLPRAAENREYWIPEVVFINRLAPRNRDVFALMMCSTKSRVIGIVGDCLGLGGSEVLLLFGCESFTPTTSKNFLTSLKKYTGAISEIFRSNRVAFDKLYEETLGDAAVEQVISEGIDAIIKSGGASTEDGLTTHVTQFYHGDQGVVEDAAGLEQAVELHSHQDKTRITTLVYGLLALRRFESINGDIQRSNCRFTKTFVDNCKKEVDDFLGASKTVHHPPLPKRPGSDISESELRPSKKSNSKTLTDEPEPRRSVRNAEKPVAPNQAITLPRRARVPNRKGRKSTATADNARRESKSVSDAEGNSADEDGSSSGSESESGPDEKAAIDEDGYVYNIDYTDFGGPRATIHIEESRNVAVDPSEFEEFIQHISGIKKTKEADVMNNKTERNHLVLSFQAAQNAMVTGREPIVWTPENDDVHSRYLQALINNSPTADLELPTFENSSPLYQQSDYLELSMKEFMLAIDYPNIFLMKIVKVKASGDGTESSFLKAVEYLQRNQARMEINHVIDADIQEDRTEQGPDHSRYSRLVARPPPITLLEEKRNAINMMFDKASDPFDTSIRSEGKVTGRIWIQDICNGDMLLRELPTVLEYLNADTDVLKGPIKIIGLKTTSAPGLPFIHEHPKNIMTQLDQLADSVHINGDTPCQDHHGKSIVGKIVTGSTSFIASSQFELLEKKGILSKVTMSEYGAFTYMTLHDDGRPHAPTPQRICAFVPVYNYSTDDRNAIMAEFTRLECDSSGNFRKPPKDETLVRISPGETLVIPPGTPYHTMSMTDCYLRGGLFMLTDALPRTLEAWSYTTRFPEIVGKDQTPKSRMVAVYLYRMLKDSKECEDTRDMLHRHFLRDLPMDTEDREETAQANMLDWLKKVTKDIFTLATPCECETDDCRTLGGCHCLLSGSACGPLCSCTCGSENSEYFQQV